MGRNRASVVPKEFAGPSRLERDGVVSAEARSVFKSIESLGVFGGGLRVEQDLPPVDFG